jgi:uncharacterized protein YfiM (DUF2279 family)
MLQKISDWVRERIGFDGLLHFAVCAIVTALIKAMAEPLLAEKGALLAVLVVAMISIAKEIYDRRTGKGCAEWKDIACDLVGIIVGVL